MADRHRLEQFLRSTAREAGERYEQARGSTTSQLDDAREAYQVAKNAHRLPSDADGRAKIVCRRYAEQRATPLDEQYRPACYEGGHPDCEGCVEDLYAGRIETW